MSRNQRKKWIFIGAVVLVTYLFFIPVLPASTSLSNVHHPVESSVEQPDLIVEQIGFAPYGDSGLEDVAYIVIKNIGSTRSKEEISYKYTFTKMLFGIIPIRIVRTHTDSMIYEGGLGPQETCSGALIYENELPKFGVYKFSCTVNPDLTNEESNYNNNELSQLFIAFFGQWS